MRELPTRLRSNLVPEYEKRKYIFDSFELEDLIEYCRANGLEPINLEPDTPKQNYISGGTSFERLLEKRAEVLGEDYRKCLPFLLQLASCKYDTLSLGKHYQHKLKAEYEDLVVPAFPDFEKELLTLDASKLVQALLLEAITNLFEGDEAEKFKNDLMLAFGYVKKEEEVIQEDHVAFTRREADTDGN